MAWPATRDENGYAVPMWTDPVAMQQRVDEYFAECKDKDEFATVTGLALALGFTQRLGLIRYETGETALNGVDETTRHDLRNTIKKAKARIEAQREQALYAGKVNPIGTIFSLKNNFGWIDKVETSGGNNFTIQLVNFDPSSLPGPTSRTISMDTTHAVLDVQPVPRIALDVTHDGETVADDGE